MGHVHLFIFIKVMVLMDPDRILYVARRENNKKKNPYKQGPWSYEATTIILHDSTVHTDMDK